MRSLFRWLRIWWLNRVHCKANPRVRGDIVSGIAGEDIDENDLVVWGPDGRLMRAKSVRDRT
jgi:hypothetical protein